jgi:hypothetical protein
MFYKNISKQPKWILQSSCKTLICPGEIVNLNISDIQHSGSAMRFFESLNKHKIVKINNWDKAEKLKHDIILRKINDEDMPELIIEKNLLVDKEKIK